jgi:hypothetical protein
MFPRHQPRKRIPRPAAEHPNAGSLPAVNLTPAKPESELV